VQLEEGGQEMNWDRLIAVVCMLLDAGILWILVEEFCYDKIIYEKEQYRKMKSRKKRFELPEAGLNTGESK
jgi:hypothetical protein